MAMEQLHPRAVWLFFVRFFFVFLFFAIFLGFFFGGFVFSGLMLALQSGQSPEGYALAVLGLLARSFLLWFVLFLAVVYAWSRLTYHFYRFELTKDSFRKESGVIIKKYVSIPYTRIQNVDINRGIMARLLGLSDLMIQTAGSSAVMYRGGAIGVGAEGLLPGVSLARAEELRDQLIAKAGK